MANVLNFRPHPAQEKFLSQSEEPGLLAFPVGQPAGASAPCATSTPSQTASPTPEPGKRYVPPANDMVWLHQMKTIECVDCGHDWIQPSATGRCPKCHSEKTRVTLERYNDLARV